MEAALQEETAPAWEVTSWSRQFPRTRGGENAPGLRNIRSQGLDSVCPVPDAEMQKLGSGSV